MAQKIFLVILVMIRKIITSLFVLIFALLAIPTLFLRSVTINYLDPGFYEGTFLDQTYSDTLSFVSDEIYKDEQVSKYFSKQEVGTLIETNFTKENIKEIVKDFVAQIKAIKDKRKTDAIKISFLPIQENISKMSEDVAKKMLSTVPSCAEGREFVLPASGELPQCLPVDYDRQPVEDEIKNIISRQLSNIIPGEFSLVTGNDETKLYESFNIVYYLEMILPLVMLIVLLLIMLIVYRPYTRVMGFSGSALVLAGIFGIATVQLMKYLPGFIADTPTDEPILNAAIVNVFTSFINVLGQKMTVYSLWLFGIGMVIIITAIFLGKSHNNPEANDA